MPSVENPSTATEMEQQLTTLGDKANFHIWKWASNCPEVLADILSLSEDRASQVNLETSNQPITKALGGSWTANDDQFSFYHSHPDKKFVYTKRNVLRYTATVFDPLGFLAPFMRGCRG